MQKWENMTAESDKESTAFALMEDGVELGHIFSEDGKTWGAWDDSSDSMVDLIGFYTTRSAAMRALRNRFR